MIEISRFISIGSMKILKEYARENKARYFFGVDIGLNLLSAVASDKIGFIPVIINGRPIKSM